MTRGHCRWAHSKDGDALERYIEEGQGVARRGCTNG